MRAVLVASMATCLGGCSLYFGDDRIADEASGGGTAAATTTGDASTASSGSPSSGGGTGEGGQGAGGPGPTTGSSSGGGAGDGGGGGDGDGGRGGAGSGGGGGEVPTCGGTSILRDAFDDIDLSDRLWTADGANGTVSHQGGDAVFAKVDPGSSSRVALVSNHLYSLVGDGVAIRVPQPLGTGSGGGTSTLQLRSGQLTVAIRVEAGQILALEGPREQLEVVMSRAYQATDVNWRIRHGGGRIVFETAPDGGAYTPLADIAASALGDLSLVGASIIATTAAGQGVGAEMRVSDVFGPFDDAVACAVSSFSDTFSTIETSPEWGVFEHRCSMSESPGTQQLDVNVLAMPAPPGRGDSYPYCTYYTNRLFDLADDAVVVQVPIAPPVDQSMGMGIDFYDLHFGGASMAIVAGQVHTTQFIDRDTVNPLSQVDVPAADRRWLRIRVSGGDTFFETSADGVQWVTRTTQATWFDATRVQIRLFVGTNAVTTTSADVAFDDYGSPP